jgi:hypothetical protein
MIDHTIEFVRGKVHTNNIENFWSLLKRTLKGTYVSVDPAHLERYLDEQSRFNERNDNDGGRFKKLVSSVTGKRLTYDELTGYARRERRLREDRTGGAGSRSHEDSLSSDRMEKFKSLAGRLINVPREELRREQDQYDAENAARRAQRKRKEPS